MFIWTEFGSIEHHHCGGVERNTVRTQLEEQLLTIIADIETPTCQVKWRVTR
jgi:hypothetical protein